MVLEEEKELLLRHRCEERRMFRVIVEADTTYVRKGCQYQYDITSLAHLVISYTAVSTKVVQKSVKAYSTMPKDRLRIHNVS